MARSRTSQRDEQHELTRRALLQWGLAAGASLGVPRSTIYEILHRTGKAFALTAPERATTRLVSLAAGNGGLSHFQLFWPQIDVANAHNPNFAWHKIGEEQLVPGTSNPLMIGPDTPWAGLPPQRQVTCFVCGATETHVRNVQSTSILNGNNVFAIATKLQALSPSLIPVVTIGSASAGTAPDAPVAANVDTADDITSLFDSAASRPGRLLAKTTDAQLYKTSYDAFVQLNRAANHSTRKTAYAVASGAAQFLGINHAPRLQITAADLARYGIDDNTRANVAAIGRAFIVIVKAFQMDLTSSVLLPAMDDDPHDHFASNDVNVVPGQLRTVFDAFMDDLTNTVDGTTGTSLADDTVIVINGDTPKHCLNRDRWPDSTPSNSNLVFIYSAGALKSGWFGGIDRNGTVQGAGPDGKPTVYNGAMTARYATASIAYAVAKGDETAIAKYANGVSIGDAFGSPKNK